MFTGTELGRAPGKTVAARGLGSRDGSSVARLSSEFSSPFVKGISNSQSFCPAARAEEGLRVWSSSCSDGDVWLPLWFRGLERPSDCAARALTSGSWCSDRLLSEWERHNLLCLCLLLRGEGKKQGSTESKNDGVSSINGTPPDCVYAFHLYTDLYQTNTWHASLSFSFFQTLTYQ